MSIRKFTRRRFLSASASVVGTLAIVPRHVLGAGATPPSETITRGVVGTGGQGMGAHVTVNEEGKTPRTLAVCDVDKKHLAAALKKTARACEGYSDFRQMLDRKDLDTIHIATPPHWHSLICIAAAQAGKDILCEKPLTRFIREGQAVIDAVERYGRVLQIGTYGRFGAQKLRKLFASGLLGSPVTVRVSPRTGYNWKVKEWSGKTSYKPEPVPPELDYDFWLGPAPFKPYFWHRVHASFRGYWDYDGGGLSDMGQHYLDPLQYALGKDETGPVEIEAYAPPAHPDACGLWGRVSLKYDDGTMLIFESGEWGDVEPDEVGKYFVIGPKGKIVGNYGSAKGSQPAELIEQANRFPDLPPLVNFETAVKTRRQPGGNASVSHRSVSLLHLSNIAIRLGRKLTYDPVKQEFPGDDQANRLVDLPMRAPWHV
jgi:myo-inositol 2-dehydrogenase/D-chiro-inositol 1-dehydrogenase